MTSPPTAIMIICPKCDRPFEGMYRPSINLGLGEKWTRKKITEANSLKCPHCEAVTEVSCLIVGSDGVFRGPDGSDSLPDSPLSGLH